MKSYKPFEQIPGVCFLLGIKYRSGTNYLFNLLKQHEDITPLVPIYEDFLLHHSDSLVEYTDNLYKSFGSKWEVPKTVGPPDMLLSMFGDILQQFIMQQVVIKNETALELVKPNHVFLSKTPSVSSLENYFRIFPDVPLIILIRDGRSVIESGMKSFGWDFDQSSREWADAALAINKFRNRYHSYKHKYLIIRYEDVFTNSEKELRKIFSFLGLDAEKYDYSSAENSAVIGSSDLRNKKRDKVHWIPVSKTSDFNPLTRWSYWKKSKHLRFQWIAGDLLSAFDYDLVHEPKVRAWWYTWNILLDFFFPIKISLKRLVNRLKAYVPSAIKKRIKNLISSKET